MTVKKRYNIRLMKGKVAVIHDWLTGMRGGEKVLEEILQLYPEADLYTLFLEKNKISERISSHPIFVSRLNRNRWIRKYYQYFLPFFPCHVEEFDLQNYGLVISSSHCVAKGVIPAPEALHISYIHSTIRYAWDQYYSYFGRLRGIRKSIVRRHISRLRTWDVASSARVDHFIANSQFVRERIWKYYRRQATVIHPPVDTDFFQPAVNPSRDYFLLVSALVPYKRIELVIQAFNGLGEKLCIVGKGSEEKHLQRLAAANIRFMGALAPDELRRLYQNARALVFSGIEDFGIAFVEAQACGIPVIAYDRGGVRDIIRHGQSGFLFAEQTMAALTDAVRQAMAMTFDPVLLRQNGLKFSPDNFRRQLSQFIAEKSQ